MSAFLKVENLSKRYGNHQAIDNVSFEIEEKKLLSYWVQVVAVKQQL